jgi:pyrimidine-nucleoside phosphorylase
MYFPDLIVKKRNGGRLSKKEIDFFISGYINDEIPDYQVASLLMAIWFSKMDEEETALLTFSMRDSGDIIDLSDIRGIKADKHSTGGVADTTTLVVAPLAAACGLKVAKMSGRGLGHTGGTLDKLESIPGLSIDMGMEQFKQTISSIGLAIMGQTRELVPADKKLYALRDVTGTVDNPSLIAASIMSKKLALGSDVIVLDVKTGSGSFMARPEDANDLARMMVDIGKKANKNICALVTDMNQPLGNAIGNALEVKEAIEILQGKHEGDLKKLCLAITARMLIAGGAAESETDALSQLSDALQSGRALTKMKEMITAQNGDPNVCNDTSLLPQAGRIIPVTADADGYIGQMQTSRIGISALMLGAGRAQKSDTIDPAVGIWMNVRLGSRVKKGDILAFFHVNETAQLENAVQNFKDALTILDQAPQTHPLIYETVT